MNVLDFLGHGAENAIPADTLAAMLQVSPRKLRSLMLLVGKNMKAKTLASGTRWKKQNVLLLCCAARNRLLKRTTQTDNRQSLLSSLLLLTMRTNT